MSPSMPAIRSSVLTLGLVLCCTSQALATGYRPPRTSSGAPDLQGVWTNQTATRLERPDVYKGLVATDAELQARVQRQAAAKAAKTAPKVQPPGEEDGDVGQGESEFADENNDLMLIDGGRRTSIITDPADGRLPFTDAGRLMARAAASPKARGLDDPEQRDPAERCIASASQAGPPMMSGPDDANYQIVQTPDHVGILSEMIHNLRLIRLNAAHAPTAGGGLQGDAVGRWEGEALMVETTGQAALIAAREVDGSMLWISPAAKVTERLQRTSPAEIRYRFTVEDPAVYTRPWSGEMVLRRVDKPIYEYACHEGNYALRNILSGARERERREGSALASAPSADSAK